jgi:hypothetical protein
MNTEKYLEDLLQHPEKYHHKIIWYVNVLRIDKRKYSVGYCTYGKGIAFVTDDKLAHLIIRDVTVKPPLDDGTPGSCSDGKWCLNPKCPFSQKKREDVNVIEKKLEEIGYGFGKVNCERIVFEKPIIEIRNPNEKERV